MNDREFCDLVQKFREEPSSTLSFEPDVGLLVDSAFCKSLDRVVHGGGLMWERRIATPDLGGSLPVHRGLYMFVWKPELVVRFAAPPLTEQFCWALYVGKAGVEEGTCDTIRHRYESDYSKFVGQDPSPLWDTRPVTLRAERLARFLTLRPLEYWFLPLTEVRDICILERKLIRLFRPPLNQQHGPRIRPGKPVPAFEEPA